jgi:hypothetical protein
MAEQLQPYRKILPHEVVDKTGQGRGFFGMRRAREKKKTAQNINELRGRHVRGEILSRSAENLFEKSPEHQQQLALVNDVVQNYCASIGIPYTPVPLHGVRTISTQEKKPETFSGQYESETGLIYIDDSLRGFELFWTILHEVLHAIGRTTFDALKREPQKEQEKKPQKGWHPRRTGYEQATKLGKQFSGFNEGVVELIVHEIAASKYNEVSQRLYEIKQAAGVDDADASYEFKFQPHSYDSHRSLVRDVIHQEARARQHEAEGETDDDTLLLKYIDPVELQMIRGYFTGDMMHLRSIEKHFGEGSLRLIAALKDTDGYGSDRGAQFRDYFTTLSDEWPTRLRIASEFIENRESFALYVRSNHEVLATIRDYVVAPLPQERTKEYERNIGLACGVLKLIERCLQKPSGTHSRRMHTEYQALLKTAEEHRERYMKTYNLNANDVPVLTARPERHLTIRHSKGE